MSLSDELWRQIIAAVVPLVLNAIYTRMVRKEVDGVAAVVGTKRSIARNKKE